MLLLAVRKDALGAGSDAPAESLLETVYTPGAADREDAFLSSLPRNFNTCGPRAGKRCGKRPGESLLRNRLIRATTLARPDHLAISRAFWADTSASETFARLLLDAMASAYRLHLERQQKHCPAPESLPAAIVNKTGRDPLPADTVEEIVALYKLFQAANPRPKAARSNKNKREIEKTLPNDAAIYACWYSQLRELVDRCPSLADKLDVVALPGGGFTGDWYIGILKGSVSPVLGRSIIEKRICTRDEEYKRFARGWAFPNRKSLIGTGRMAWPRAWEVPLERVLRIHCDCAFALPHPGLFRHLHWPPIASGLATHAPCRTAAEAGVGGEDDTNSRSPTALSRAQDDAVIRGTNLLPAIFRYRRNAL